MDLTCLGIILVDMFPAEVGKPLTDVDSFTPKPGGAPANVAVAARRLGSPTAFIGKVGDDIFGHWLKKTLSDEKVETSGMVFDTEARTTLVFIGMPSDQEAEFVFYRNPGADMRLKKDEINPRLLEESKALHFDSLSLTNTPYREATLAAVDVVKQHGGFISYDVNFRPTMWPSSEAAIQAARDVLPFCDVVKVNEEELQLITGRSDPQEGGRAILALGCQLSLITLGERGAHYVTHHQSGYLPAYRVKTIDAVGCGDSFLGAMLHQLTQAESLDAALASGEIESMLRFAMAAGALTSTKRGAMPALPTRTEVEFFLNHTHEKEEL